MRLKNYTNEEIKNNINNIVFLEIYCSKTGYLTKKPEIIKVTGKQFKTSNLGTRTVNFTDVGSLSYRCGFFLEKDVDYVIGVFQRLSIEKLSNEIEQAEKEIKQIKKLKRINS